MRGQKHVFGAKDIHTGPKDVFREKTLLPRSQHVFGAENVDTGQTDVFGAKNVVRFSLGAKTRVRGPKHGYGAKTCVRGRKRCARGQKMLPRAEIFWPHVMGGMISVAKTCARGKINKYAAKTCVPTQKRRYGAKTRVRGQKHGYGAKTCVRGRKRCARGQKMLPRAEIFWAHELEIFDPWPKHVIRAKSINTGPKRVFQLKNIDTGRKHVFGAQNMDTGPQHVFGPENVVPGARKCCPGLKFFGRTTWGN